MPSTKRSAKERRPHLRMWALLFVLGFSTGVFAQEPPTIVLDPAHGGSDTGATIADKVLERDLTVAISNRLRALLIARGFNVAVTHSTPSDANDLTDDKRAEAANRAGAIACLSLHASGSGNGVHFYTSSLPEMENALASSPTAWNRAQGPYVSRSLRLATELQAAVLRSRIPATNARTFMATLDSFTCPAVVIEIGPNGDTSPQNATYQQQVAEAVAGALLFWRGHPNAVTSAEGGSR